MKRIPIAIGLALAIVTAAVVTINVAPAQDVVYIDATTPKNVTLSGLPKAIVFNLASGTTYIHMYMPGGVIVDAMFGYTSKDYKFWQISLSSAGQAVIYFNGTFPVSGAKWSYYVVTPPETVTIRIQR